MKKEKKPEKKELTEKLEKIIQEYSPEYYSPEAPLPRTMITAFRELNENYPEIIQFPQFLTLYTPSKKPEQMAEEILQAPRRRVISDVGRMGKRGIGRKLRQFQELDDIFFRTEKIIEAFNAKINKFELFDLIRMACHGLQKERLLTETIKEIGYPEEVRKLVDWCLEKLLYAARMFYEELDYDDERKAKIVMTIFPKDSGLYRWIKSKGKKPTRESIQKRFKTFRGYIKGEIPSGEISRDREFYDINFFAYLAWMYKGVHFLLDIEREDRKETVKQEIKRMLQEFLWEDQVEILRDLEEELNPLSQAYKRFLSTSDKGTNENHP